MTTGDATNATVDLDALAAVLNDEAQKDRWAEAENSLRLAAREGQPDAQRALAAWVAKTAGPEPDGEEGEVYEGYPSNTTWRRLKPGSVGAEVRVLQIILINAGYDIDIDGVFGEETTGVVIDYQKRCGLPPDGVVRKRMWEALDGFESDSKLHLRMPRMELCDEGRRVRVLQLELARRGHELPADGFFGEETARAVRRFQREQGHEPTGVVDDETWVALGF